MKINRLVVAVLAFVASSCGRSHGCGYISNSSETGTSYCPNSGKVDDHLARVVLVQSDGDACAVDTEPTTVLLLIT